MKKDIDRLFELFDDMAKHLGIDVRWPNGNPSKPIFTDKPKIDSSTGEDDFELILGSKVWPSNDPNDSPYDIYKCKRCGFEFIFKSCGSFQIGEKEAIGKFIQHQKAIHFSKCGKIPGKKQ